MTVPPLLLLAEGRKPRLRRAPRNAPKEIALHMQVAALLRQHARPEWRWTHIPSGERRDKRTAAKLKRMGVKAGWPDFVLIDPAGRLYALELKRVGEALSDTQEDFRSWCEAHGVPHVTADTMTAALAAFASWRCLADDAAALIGGDL